MVKPDNSVIQYRYNAEGLREVKVREDGSEVRYLLDGLVVLCEYDGNLNILKEYVPGISMKTNGNTYYYITDRLGSVRYVLDETGAIVNSYTYTPFGQIHSSSGSLNQPYRYVGGEFYYTEDTTGLQLLGQRWYGSEVGRFISRDPIGEEGGLNLYVYVGNNAVNLVDAVGLFGWGDIKDKQQCHAMCNKAYDDCISAVNKTYQKTLQIIEKAHQDCLSACDKIPCKDSPTGKLAYYSCIFLCGVIKGMEETAAYAAYVSSWATCGLSASFCHLGCEIFWGN